MVIPNFARMYLTKYYWMQQNAWFTASTFASYEGKTNRRVGAGLRAGLSVLNISELSQYIQKSHYYILKINLIIIWYWKWNYFLNQRVPMKKNRTVKSFSLELLRWNGSFMSNITWFLDFFLKCNSNLKYFWITKAAYICLISKN